MISTTCHNAVDLTLQPTMETAPVSARGIAGPLQEAIGEVQAEAVQHDDAWLASLINSRRDAIELSEAIFQARIQAEQDQEQQRLQDLLRRMMEGLSETNCEVATDLQSCEP